MPRLFQIHESDLAELERIVPHFADRLMGQMDNALRMKIRRAKEVLSNVRWNYGPPGEVTIIDAGDCSDSDDAPAPQTPS